MRLPGSGPNMSKAIDLIQKLTLIGLILVAVFDPADKIFHLKVPLFVSAFGFFSLEVAKRQSIRLSKPLVLYLSAFVFILPLISILRYILFQGDFYFYDGFMYWKSYLFLMITVVLFSKNMDLLLVFVKVLTAMSIFILAIAILGLQIPALGTYFSQVGLEYGFLYLGFEGRQYGGMTFHTIYYVTSPMLVMAVAYFSHKVISTSGTERIWSSLLLLLNCAAMFLSGTRNNILCSIGLPLLVFYWKMKDRKHVRVWGTIAILTAGAALVSANVDVFREMFSPEDVSNSIKLGLVDMYLEMFSNASTLLFGQGVGSYFIDPTRGAVSVSELTYFEFIRNYGLLGGIVYFLLLVYPLKMLMSKQFREDHFVYLAYAAYLFVCISNPLLISSSGMLILSVVLYKTFSLLALQRREL